MSEKTYAGVPRNKIPWYPIIDYEKCAYGKCDICADESSGPKCLEFCAHKVFAVAEEQKVKKLIVKNPYNCVVFCTSCQKICPIPDALTFPDKKEVTATIQKLREESR